MKTPLLLIIIILLTSCNNEEFFADKKFYKIQKENQVNKMILTFLNDTIAAINDTTFKDCNWEFLKLKKHKNGLYNIEENKFDTTWFKIDENQIVLQLKKDKIKFDEFNIDKSKIEKIYERLKISKDIAMKNITFDCEYQLEQIPNFYEKSVEIVKRNLKNPNSAKFTRINIRKFERNYLKTDTTLVSLKIEATNGFGGIIEDNFYVYFIPYKNKPKYFHTEFSEFGDEISDLHELVY